MPGDFLKEYSKLNSDQKTAVDHIEGPVLVIAGPGTGKTQLLSLRAANILSKTDSLPENILCLTYSDSGAQAMKSRLIKMIGEDAYNINVSTYHSFGNDIIQNNLRYFSNQNLKPINALKSQIIIRDIIKQLPYDNNLAKLINVSKISKLIDDAKKSLLSPSDFQTIAKENISFIKEASKITKQVLTNLTHISLKSIDSFNQLLIAGNDDSNINGIESLRSFWNRDLEEALNNVELTKKTNYLTKWKNKYIAKDRYGQFISKGELQNINLDNFAKIYDQYQKTLIKDGVYDFNDMIIMAIKALKENDDLRFNLQEQYNYIMLDEYQDTNLSQAELISLLTDNPASEGRPNIMAVGDDDQAIYAFQGAKHSNMIDFIKQYTDVKQISLKNNYRSSQNIIDLGYLVANQISQRLSKELNITKEFKAVNKKSGYIEHLYLNNEIESYVKLAQKLKNEDGTIAIIAPKHRHLERVSHYLNEAGLEISYERNENILDNQYIGQIIQILKLIEAIANNEYKLANHLLSIILNYDFWQLPTELIWKIAKESYDQKKLWLDVMLIYPQTRILALMFIKLAANSKTERYDSIIGQILGLNELQISDSDTKFSKVPFLEYIKDDLESLKLFQNLTIIKEEFIKFNQDNDRPLMIKDFNYFIEEIRSLNYKLTNKFNYGNNDNKIHLLTAHGAKGLEFDSVYLLSFVNELWGIQRNNNDYISLPPNLVFIKQQPQDNDDDRLRLLYVALTRAKNKLTTIGYQQTVDNKQTTPIKYLQNINQDITDRLDVDLKPLWLPAKRQLRLDNYDKKLKEILLSRVDNYSLNPTDLNYFLDLEYGGPESFYLKTILKYPSAPNPAADYGSSIHDSLDWLQKYLKNNNSLPTIQQLTDEFKELLSGKRLTKNDLNNYIHRGINALTIFYQTNKDNFSIDDLSEQNFKDERLMLKNVRITGKIDKIIIDKITKSLTIVDYKTSKAYSTFDSSLKSHLYKNQLYFYKLLVKRSRKFNNYNVKNAFIEYVNPKISSDDITRLDLNYQKQEMSEFIKLLEAVWEHISNLNFPDVSKYQADIKGIKKFEDDLINQRV